jgi:hypothetical protein
MTKNPIPKGRCEICPWCREGFDRDVGHICEGTAREHTRIAEAEALVLQCKTFEDFVSLLLEILEPEAL